MSVFDTSRPDDSNKRYQKALEAAITRKNNRRRLSEERAIAEESARVSSALEAITENVETPVTDTRRMTRRVLENKNKALQMLESRLIKEGYNTCFNNVIFGMVYESFWADDAVKESTVNQMYQTFTETLDLLESLGIKQIPSNKQNQFMQNVAELVTEACKKSAERIAEEAECNKDGKTSDDIETISFAMTDGEMNELDDNLADLSPDEITTLVKNKVLQVVQDEKECGKKKSDAFKEIDDEKVKIETEYEDDDDEKEDETDDMDEEKDKDNDTEDDMDDDKDDEKDVKESLSYRKLVNAAKTRKMHKQVGSSLFESIMMNSTNNVRTRLEASMESSIPNKKDVMDAAFMESMLVYTILETVQTVGLYSFSREDITKLKNHYKKFN